jgi:hypothetical protein
VTALVYSAEIRAEYDCSVCAANPEAWAALGKCTGAVPEPLVVPVWARDKDGTLTKCTEFFEDVEFRSCPRAFIREDLNPDGMRTAVIALHASQAEIRRQWPDVPAKLWQLVGLLEAASDVRRETIFRAGAALRSR